MGIIYKYHNFNFCSKYTSIRTAEQKSRYKAEFNADYKEYRKLHSVIDKVSKRFAHLEERLLKSEHGSQDYEVSVLFLLRVKTNLSICLWPSSYELVLIS